MTDPVCPPGTAFAATVDAVRRGERDVVGAVADLLAQLGEQELLGLLDGDLPVLEGFRALGKREGAAPWEAGRVDRLGIPGIRLVDGPRGVAMGASTAFPAAIARAASFDTDLERAVGDAIGAEARAQGANLVAAPCVNLAPAPGWGRSQESSGEDPVLLGAMGASLVRGMSPWVLTCVKHLALNSMEEARFRVDVTVAEDVLREVYLPHFRAVVEAGVDAVMSAYNAVNGTWAGEHRHLLTEVLREDWGFTGFVMTDFVWGLRHPVESVAAGQDLEMPFRQQRAASLPRALARGRLARADVERAATRLLTVQVALALRARPTPSAGVVASPEHRELAREAARRGSVLLRNELVGGVAALPLDEGSLRRVAVLGPLADDPNPGDVGSSRVLPPSTTTVLGALRERLGDRATHVAVGGGDDAQRAAAAAAARDADAAVVVVGLSSTDEGESLVGMDAAAMRLLGGVARFRPVAAALAGLLRWGVARQGWGGDRRDLRLHAGDVALVRAVARANPRTVVVVVAGGTVVLDPWEQDVAAVLLAWYPGMEGGRAVADVLLGDHEPTGRLPFALPHRRADLPVLDWRARRVVYGRWWGQRKLDRDGVAAAHPFGSGLGYTTFVINGLQVGPVVGERFPAVVALANTGARAGRHVVQVYAHLPGAGGPDGPVRALLGFAVVRAGPGEVVTARVDCTTRPLQRWTGGRFVVETDSVRVEAASSSRDPLAVTAVLSGLTRMP